jgi:ketopantoate hydroxymethyltransferase
LGLNQDFTPKFVKTFSELGGLTIKALDAFHSAVKAKKFPTKKESYS